MARSVGGNILDKRAICKHPRPNRKRHGLHCNLNTRWFACSIGTTSSEQLPQLTLGNIAGAMPVGLWLFSKMLPIFFQRTYILYRCYYCTLYIKIFDSQCLQWIIKCYLNYTVGYISSLRFKYIYVYINFDRNLAFCRSSFLCLD